MKTDFNIDKDVIKKYIPDKVTGIGCILTAEKIRNNNLECMRKSYELMDDSYKRYKERVKYNNKWYVRFCRFIKNLF